MRSHAVAGGRKADTESNRQAAAAMPPTTGGGLRTAAFLAPTFSRSIHEPPTGRLHQTTRGATALRAGGWGSITRGATALGRAKALPDNLRDRPQGDERRCQNPRSDRSAPPRFSESHQPAGALPNMTKRRACWLAARRESRRGVQGGRVGINNPRSDRSAPPRFP